jgi:hypothetical protein
MTVVEPSLNGLIDYAGLFPPAGLDMPTSARNYVSYRSGRYAWVLGRLIIPVARLIEFNAALIEVAARVGLRFIQEGKRDVVVVGGIDHSAFDDERLLLSSWGLRSSQSDTGRAVPLQDERTSRRIRRISSSVPLSLRQDGRGSAQEYGA